MSVPTASNSSSTTTRHPSAAFETSTPIDAQPTKPEKRKPRKREKPNHLNHIHDLSRLLTIPQPPSSTFNNKFAHFATKARRIHHVRAFISPLFFSYASSVSPSANASSSSLEVCGIIRHLASISPSPSPASAPKRPTIDERKPRAQMGADGLSSYHFLFSFY